MKRGDHPAAATAYREYLREHPDSSSIRLKLAELLRETAPQDAVKILHEVPPDDPLRVAAVQQIAIIRLLAGQDAEAEPALLEVAAADPDNLGVQLSLAELYFRRGDAEAALPHALQAARLGPDRAQTFLLIADIHDELHNPAAMMEPLRTAIRIDPSYYEARLNLAYAALKTGDLATAHEQAEWCRNVHPRDVATIRILATVARDEGRFEEARTLLAEALRLQPQDLDSRILEADLLLYERQPQRAYDRLKEIFDQNSTTVRYLGVLARAAAASGKRDEARQIYQTVETLLAKSRRPMEPGESVPAEATPSAPVSPPVPTSSPATK